MHPCLNQLGGSLLATVVAILKKPIQVLFHELTSPLFCDWAFLNCKILGAVDFIIPRRIGYIMLVESSCLTSLIFPNMTTSESQTSR